MDDSAALLLFIMDLSNESDWGWTRSVFWCLFYWVSIIVWFPWLTEEPFSLVWCHLAHRELALSMNSLLAKMWTLFLYSYGFLFSFWFDSDSSKKNQLIWVICLWIGLRWLHWMFHSTPTNETIKHGTLLYCFIILILILMIWSVLKCFAHP